ncbi:MAG TPA: NAD(P)-dependent oxidoreductase [Acidimicrobiales bacterium]|nr:NAD(P)-dependent oxidoreductase [Acidimicrobiales bacterium]
MLEGQKILITGANGRVAFPIARALAQNNEVWGVARFTDPGSQSRLEEAGVRPVPLDVAAGNFSSLPDDFTHVFHAAMSSGAEGWASAFEMNSQASGSLLHHCRAAKGFVFCSTGSIYQYQGRRPLTEKDPPGVPRLDSYGNYSFSKVAGEAVCTWVSRQFGVPLTIIRICSTYGPEGGTPVDRFERMLAGKPIRLHPDAPNNFNPIYEDDYVALGVRAMEVASVPPVVVNWAGSETVSAEEYCTYMGELVGIEPTFLYDPVAHSALWPDVNYMHEVLGRTKVHWRDGFRRTIEARHPELPLRDV